MPRTSSTRDGKGAPIAMHSRTSLPTRFADEIRTRMLEKLKPAGSLVERSSVRFDDVGSEVHASQTSCQIEVVVTGHPAAHAEARGADAPEAFRHALIKLTKALARIVGKAANGSNGEGAVVLDAEISPDHRSVHRNASRATVVLEESETRPSRKSTRSSGTRAKAAQSKERTALAKSLTPKAKASTANARGGKRR